MAFTAVCHSPALQATGRQVVIQEFAQPVARVIMASRLCSLAQHPRHSAVSSHQLCRVSAAASYSNLPLEDSSRIGSCSMETTSINKQLNTYSQAAAKPCPMSLRTWLLAV